VLFFAVPCLNHCKKVELTSNIFINRQIKNNNYFSPKRERKKKEEKKDMLFKQPVKRRLSRFFDKILPDQREVWRFWQKPEGLDLYCR